MIDKNEARLNWPIAVNLTFEDYSTLLEMSARNGQSMSGMMRLVLRDAIEKSEQQKQDETSSV